MGQGLCKQDGSDGNNLNRQAGSFLHDEAGQDKAFYASDDSLSDEDDDIRQFGGKTAQHSMRTVTKRVFLIAKELPLKIIREESAEGRPKWSISWEDARNFLGNIRGLEQEGTEVWFVGSPKVDIDDAEQEDFETALTEFKCVPVFLNPDLKRRFHDNFCKNVLWPVLHYVLPHHSQEWARKWDDAWQAYTAANILYASTVSRLAEASTDSIWVHNYHLFLVPSFIRNKRPRVKIGFFVHTPWCSSDVFRVLPQAENILRGILSCDLIGFHTFDYVRHFLSSCKRVLQNLEFETRAGGRMHVKYQGRCVSILVSHVGIDSNFFQTRTNVPEVALITEGIKKKYVGKKIILSVDTLDMVKASVLKFEMWEYLLDHHPELRDSLVLVAFLLPDSDLRHKEYVRAAVNKQVDRIRGKYGDGVIDFQETTRIEMDHLISLYRSSEMLLVTTFWDGLNVLPYEYTATQDPADPGALIVSEFMGCSRSLSGVMRVNPWNLAKTSDAVIACLAQTKEERIGLQNLRIKYVMEHDAVFWAKGFLRNLDEAARMVVDLSFITVGFGSNVRLVGLRNDFRHLDEEDVLESYKRCTARCIFVDYDGTLTDAQDRGFNGANPAVTSAFKAICSDPANLVFIISGRRRSWLQAQLGHIKELGLAAEKGSFLRWPASLEKSCRKNWSKQTQDPEMDSLWENSAPVRGDLWKKDILETLREYTAHTDGSSIEDKDLSIVWHFENSDPEFGLLQATELQKFLNKVMDTNIMEVVIYNYSRIVEIKPKGVDKGNTATHIISRLKKVLGRKIDPSKFFLMAIGDDTSDESMFKAMTEIGGTGKKENAKAEAMAELRQARATKTKKATKPEPNPNTFTCVVGMKPSEARYYMQGHHEVIETIESFGQASAAMGAIPPHLAHRTALD